MCRSLALRLLTLMPLDIIIFLRPFDVFSKIGWLLKESLIFSTLAASESVIDCLDIWYTKPAWRNATLRPTFLTAASSDIWTVQLPCILIWRRVQGYKQTEHIMCRHFGAKMPISVCQNFLSNCCTWKFVDLVPHVCTSCAELSANCASPRCSL